MSNRFAIGDTHFSHTSTWAKHRSSANPELPMRPFTSNEEMDEYMIQRWNSVVGYNDIVYHLGDVAMSTKGLECVKRLNGRKRLVMGNHEHAKNKFYYECGFEELYGVAVFIKNQFVMTHVPVHPCSIEHRWKRNVHGHMHDNFVRHPKWDSKPDPRYLCVSVEQTDYRPISFDEIEERFNEL